MLLFYGFHFPCPYQDSSFHFFSFFGPNMPLDIPWQNWESDARKMVWMSGWVTEESFGSEVRWEASNDGRTQYSNKQNATSGNLQLCKVEWNLKIQTCRFEPHPGIKRMPSAGKTNQTTIQCFFCGLFSWLFHPFLCLYIFSAFFCSLFHAYM